MSELSESHDIALFNEGGSSSTSFTTGVTGVTGTAIFLAASSWTLDDGGQGWGRGEEEGSAACCNELLATIGGKEGAVKDVDWIGGGKEGAGKDGAWLGGGNKGAWKDGGWLGGGNDGDW